MDLHSNSRLGSLTSTWDIHSRIAYPWPLFLCARTIKTVLWCTYPLRDLIIYFHILVDSLLYATSIRLLFVSSDFGSTQTVDPDSIAMSIKWPNYPCIRISVPTSKLFNWESLSLAAWHKVLKFVDLRSANLPTKMPNSYSLGRHASFSIRDKAKQACPFRDQLATTWQNWEKEKILLFYTVVSMDTSHRHRLRRKACFIFKTISFIYGALELRLSPRLAWQGIKGLFPERTM